MKNDYQEHELTAYLLDELDDQRRTEIERIIRESPGARENFEQLQNAIAEVNLALATEPVTSLSDEQRRALEAEFERSRNLALMPGVVSEPASRIGWVRWVRPVAAVACLMVVSGLAWHFLNPRTRVSPAQPAAKQQLTRLDSVPAPPNLTEPTAGARKPSLPATEQAPKEELNENSVRSRLAFAKSDEADKLKSRGGAPPTAAVPAPEGRAANADRGQPLADHRRAGNAETALFSYDRAKNPPAVPPVVSSPAKGGFAAGSGQGVGGVVGGIANAKDGSLSRLGTSVKMPSPAFAARESEPFNTESYEYQADNEMTAVAKDPLSTFSIDVDTASYSNVRRFLREGQLPPPDAVRIEEMINYFPYDYEPPHDGSPFAVATEVAQAPWAPDHRLIRIALKGRELPEGDRPDVNLVFLLDVSGSMESPVKLSLVKQALRLLVDKLQPTDRVAIVVYAGSSGLVLPSTPGSNRQRILDAIDQLEAGGSTNGAAGIQLAYQEALANFKANGINRVILATDGDFNVGVTNQGELVRLVQEQAAKGVYLTALGFGIGNYKDSMLEKLADKGNGNYSYIDSLDEARKVLVEQMGGTLVTIAKDVKIQVEFNPLEVTAYRLIGYENRVMAHQDFDDDRKDAGEIGAGHTVTALYEVVPVGVPVDLPQGEPLKYQRKSPTATPRGELLTVKLRYKLPNEETSRGLEVPVIDSMRAFSQASDDFRFAASVAGFGMILRKSPFKGSATLQSMMQIADTSRHFDPQGYRAEFVRMVSEASRLAASR